MRIMQANCCWQRASSCKTKLPQITEYNKHCSNIVKLFFFSLWEGEKKWVKTKKFLLLFEIKDFLPHNVFQKSPSAGGKSMYFYNINNTIKIGCEAAANYLPYATLPPTAASCLVGLLNYNVQSPLYSCVAHWLNCCWKGILGEWKHFHSATHINGCPY